MSQESSLTLKFLVHRVALQIKEHHRLGPWFLYREKALSAVFWRSKEFKVCLCHLNIIFNNMNHCLPNIVLISNLHFNFFLKILFIFRGRGREGKGEGEKHQCVVTSHAPPLGTWPATQASALTGNGTCDPLVCRPMLNPLSYTSQGLHFSLTGWKGHFMAREQPQPRRQCGVKKGHLFLFCHWHVLIFYKVWILW